MLCFITGTTVVPQKRNFLSNMAKWYLFQTGECLVALHLISYRHTPLERIFLGIMAKYLQKLFVRGSSFGGRLQKHKYFRIRTVERQLTLILPQDGDILLSIMYQCVHSWQCGTTGITVDNAKKGTWRRFMMILAFRRIYLTKLFSYHGILSYNYAHVVYSSESL